MTSQSETTPDGNVADDELFDIAEAADVVHGFEAAAAVARKLPHKPGVYLMKDKSERVIYIGKAKDLRKRVSSYFKQAAIDDARTGPMVREIDNIDFIEAESEVDALLMEARLIKDIQPKFNRDLKDGKSFPYLQIRTHEDFPRVEVTRTPKDHSVKLFGPFPSADSLRGAILVLQKIFKFRTCSLDIKEDDECWQWFRPCLLHAIHQCSGACNKRIAMTEYRGNINKLIRFLDGKKKRLIDDMLAEMKQAAAERQYELAAELRDQITNLQTLDKRGEIDTHVQPEVFMIDPRRGVVGLQRIFHLEKPPRIIEGVDIAHLSGNNTVASLVHFIDGLPFKPGYRRYKIENVKGIDDFASIAETISRRFAHSPEERTPPDIMLIDGGKGQLHAAQAALKNAASKPGLLISLAKQDEEIYTIDSPAPIKLTRHSFALRLLQYVRDESHRFAQHYHHILRKKSTFGK
ncbi:MAG: excinuclease ABC subunit UvrC [Planctomycetaceae bacterium]|jgi:excinuclease ABC subunit C|nr:excinuclease ABC subunit UvrC [Planctomycetaceae bacterium]